jgi:hypothetical protein
MTRARVDLADIPDDVREKLGLPASTSTSGRRRRLTKDDIRGHALRVLAVVAGLSKADRGRVLDHARKVNAL